MFWQKIQVSELNIKKKCSPMALWTSILWTKWVLVGGSLIIWILRTQATSVFGVSVLLKNSHQNPVAASAVPGALLCNCCRVSLRKKREAVLCQWSWRSSSHLCAFTGFHNSSPGSSYTVVWFLFFDSVYQETNLKKRRWGAGRESRSDGMLAETFFRRRWDSG